MNISDNLNAIFPVGDNLSKTEKFSAFEVSYETTLSVVNSENLPKFFEQLSKDFSRLSLSVYDSHITITSENKDYETFLQQVLETKSSIEDEKVILTFAVSKAVNSNSVFIYDIESFSRFWNSQDLFQILEFIGKKIKEFKQVHFVYLFEDGPEIYTENIAFTSHSDLVVPINSNIDVGKIRSNCHFENFEQFPFSSKYFRLITRPKSTADFTDTLDKLSLLFCITGVFDITSLNGKNLYSKLNGYKSIEYNIDINELNTDSLQIYENIYDWIYSEKSQVTDKIGLARNIISLYLKPGQLSISDNVFTSIASGFKTYLQQNVSKYIEVRNKIGDQISSISQKTNDLAEKYLNNYQRSNFAFISFFISIFILRVVSTSKFENIFNKDTTLIFFCLIGVSLLYFFFSLILVNQESARLRIKYNQLKLRHEDLLDRADINNILRNDEEFNDDMKFLLKRRNWYSVLWISTIMLFIITVVSLSTYLSWSDFSLLKFKLR